MKKIYNFGISNGDEVCNINSAPRRKWIQAIQQQQQQRHEFPSDEVALERSIRSMTPSPASTISCCTGGTTGSFMNNFSRPRSCPFLEQYLPEVLELTWIRVKCNSQNQKEGLPESQHCLGCNTQHQHEYVSTELKNDGEDKHENFPPVVMKKTTKKRSKPNNDGPSCDGGDDSKNEETTTNKTNKNQKNLSKESVSKKMDQLSDADSGDEYENNNPKKRKRKPTKKELSDIERKNKIRDDNEKATKTNPKKVENDKKEEFGKIKNNKRTISSNASTTKSDIKSDEYRKPSSFSWILENPVEAMHLSSQFLPAGSSSLILNVESLFQFMTQMGQESGGSTDVGGPPVLFGEEQERWMALTHAGYPAIYYPCHDKGGVNCTINSMEDCNASNKKDGCQATDTKHLLYNHSHYFHQSKDNTRNSSEGTSNNIANSHAHHNKTLDHYSVVVGGREQGHNTMLMAAVPLSAPSASALIAAATENCIASDNCDSVAKITSGLTNAKNELVASLTSASNKMMSPSVHQQQQTPLDTTELFPSNEIKNISYVKNKKSSNINVNVNINCNADSNKKSRIKGDPASVTSSILPEAVKSSITTPACSSVDNHNSITGICNDKAVESVPLSAIPSSLLPVSVGSCCNVIGNARSSIDCVPTLISSSPTWMIKRQQHVTQHLMKLEDHFLAVRSAFLANRSPVFKVVSSSIPLSPDPSNESPNKDHYVSLPPKKKAKIVGSTKGATTSTAMKQTKVSETTAAALGNITSDNSDVLSNKADKHSKINPKDLSVSITTSGSTPFVMSLYRYLQAWKEHLDDVTEHSSSIRTTVTMPILAKVGTGQVRLQLPPSFNDKCSSQLSSFETINSASEVLLLENIGRQWKEKARCIADKVEIWMDQYRMNRASYWKEQRRKVAQERLFQQQRYGKLSHTEANSVPGKDYPVVSRSDYYENKTSNLSNVFGAIRSNNCNGSIRVKATDTARCFTETSYSSLDDNNHRLRPRSRETPDRYCKLCDAQSSSLDKTQRAWSMLFSTHHKAGENTASMNSAMGVKAVKYGDEVMQCLECSFVGCAPNPVDKNAKVSSCHIIQHMILSKHYLAVSCGSKARIYSFKSGDYIYHKVFEQEKFRLDLCENLPFLGWDEHPIQRSFDPYQFVRVSNDYNGSCSGIFWSGRMNATYPVLVLAEHQLVASHCRMRQIMFQGRIEEFPILEPGINSRCVDFTAIQSRRAEFHRCSILAPTGFYNLGNTCAMSAVLQCLIHCRPLQRFFIRDVGHDHIAFEIYRKMELPSIVTASSSMSKKAEKSDFSKRMEMSEILNGELLDNDVCLASELDKLFVKYFSSSIGYDVLSILSNMHGVKHSELNDTATCTTTATHKGEPLLLNNMLTAVWACRGMQHLAGYDQRDAHEFLHAFLDNVGKGTLKYRKLIKLALGDSQSGASKAASNDNSLAYHDIAKKLFEGTLRSILICQECGNKRAQNEQFMSISLPFSKEAQKRVSETSQHKTEQWKNLSVERCLRHFTLPELLSDHVVCPACCKKTTTKKQHVFAKLPQILCFHLKRFDSSLNRKIEDFVSFPAKGLNMGPYLPHWAEVTGASSSGELANDVALPSLLYNLFATVNHSGSLESGHYVANVAVRSRWYHCNDSYIGSVEEHDVLNSEGAYLLFYERSQGFTNRERIGL